MVVLCKCCYSCFISRLRLAAYHGVNGKASKMGSALITLKNLKFTKGLKFMCVYFIIIIIITIGFYSNHLRLGSTLSK